MSFVDDLYKDKTVPQDAWMREVNWMCSAIGHKVKFEHARGKHRIKGYFAWADSDTYFYRRDEKCTYGGTLTDDYPIQDMMEALRKKLKEMGFTYYRVYYANGNFYDTKFTFSFGKKYVPKHWKTICVDLAW